MVSPQATQDGNSSHPTDWPKPRANDSVRITAEIRRQVLAEFFGQELPRQRAVSAAESNDLKVLRGNGQPTAQAELRASNAAAVLQYVGSMAKAFGGNRDFRGVAR